MRRYLPVLLYLSPETVLLPDHAVYLCDGLGLALLGLLQHGVGVLQPGHQVLIIRQAARPMTYIGIKALSHNI